MRRVFFFFISNTKEFALGMPLTLKELGSVGIIIILTLLFHFICLFIYSEDHRIKGFVLQSLEAVLGMVFTLEMLV